MDTAADLFEFGGAFSTAWFATISCSSFDMHTAYNWQLSLLKFLKITGFRNLTAQNWQLGGCSLSLLLSLDTTSSWKTNGGSMTSDRSSFSQVFSLKLCSQSTSRCKILCCIIVTEIVSHLSEFFGMSLVVKWESVAAIKTIYGFTQKEAEVCYDHW